MPNKKMNYVEPSGYFTPSMKKILKEGEKKAPAKKSSTIAKKSTKKQGKRRKVIATSLSNLGKTEL